jgi:hypothetical protein
VRSIDPLEPAFDLDLDLELASPVRSLTRCRVCGFAEVRTDEVVDRGLLLLAECPRCEDRWTLRASPVLPVARALPARAASGSARDAGEAAAAA